MTETLITHDIAFEAKKLGCPLIKNVSWLPTKTWAKTNISQSLLQKWLREEHNMHIAISQPKWKHQVADFWAFEIDPRNGTIHGSSGYPTYECALEHALTRCVQEIRIKKDETDSSKE